MNRQIFSPPPPGALWRNLIRLGAFALTVLVLHLLMLWAQSLAPQDTTSLRMPVVTLTALVVYALLVAVPFMPGVEIGISLLVMKGAAAAPFVWLATCIGLSIAFLAGRFMPYTWISSLLRDLCLARAAKFLDSIHDLPSETRLEVMTERLPQRLGGAVTRWRYVALAILINLPGNSVIGGGGGISMVAGLSRVYGVTATLIAIMLAVSPVPLLVMWLGPTVLPWTH